MLVNQLRISLTQANCYSFLKLKGQYIKKEKFQQEVVDIYHCSSSFLAMKPWQDTQTLGDSVILFKIQD